LDDLEELADGFKLANGYMPELLSHWDPKLEFELEIERWILQRQPTASLVQYIYSSYLEVDDRVRARLHEGRERGLILTPSGTTSIATIVTYLRNIGVQHLHLITPAYFVVETLASSFGLSISFTEIVREHERYRLPENVRVGHHSAIWLTFPIYGTSCYISPSEVAVLIDALPSDVIVVVDESLAYPDRDSLSETKTIERVLRISTPHKALCVNGEKVSVITFPEHLSDALNAWSECFAGGIGASGLTALQFLASDSYDQAVMRSRQLAQSLRARMIHVLRGRKSVSLDKETDGHFVMLYWPTLPMFLSRKREFLESIINASGAVAIPASRNRHPEHYGFAFRVNLFRLDEAGLGGLRRLADVLDRNV
jgi:histidinol-phosphate/aromatic aminotransferase/cobyric acid decarboxylase-like protein